jgi:MarR family transcriptional regulator for hemolysin
MNDNMGLIIWAKSTKRLYEKLCEPICKKYNISQLELDVIAFLENNPKYDTASDIVEMRLLSKSNVSQAIEMLIKKNMLCRNTDKIDRRKIHLQLQTGVNDIINEICDMQCGFKQILFNGFNNIERKQFSDMLLRISENCNINNN